MDTAQQTIWSMKHTQNINIEHTLHITSLSRKFQAEMESWQRECENIWRMTVIVEISTSIQGSGQPLYSMHPENVYACLSSSIKFVNVGLGYLQ